MPPFNPCTCYYHSHLTRGTRMGKGMSDMRHIMQKLICSAFSVSSSSTSIQTNCLFIVFCLRDHRHTDFTAHQWWKKFQCLLVSCFSSAICAMLPAETKIVAKIMIISHRDANTFDTRAHHTYDISPLQKTLMLNKWNEMSTTLGWCVRGNVSKINIAHGNGGEEQVKELRRWSKQQRMGEKQTRMPTLAIFHLFCVWQIFSFGDYFVFSFSPPHTVVLSIAVRTRRHLFIRRLSYGTNCQRFFPHLPLPANFSSYFHFFRMVRVPLISIAPSPFTSNHSFS